MVRGLAAHERDSGSVVRALAAHERDGGSVVGALAAQANLGLIPITRPPFRVTPFFTKNEIQ